MSLWFARLRKNNVNSLLWQMWQPLFPEDPWSLSAAECEVTSTITTRELETRKTGLNRMNSQRWKLSEKPWQTSFFWSNKPLALRARRKNRSLWPPAFGWCELKTLAKVAQSRQPQDGDQISLVIFSTSSSLTLAAQTLWPAVSAKDQCDPSDLWDFIQK